MVNCRCNSRCGCDFSSRAARLPDLTSGDVVFGILFDVARKLFARSRAAAMGDMSDDQYQAKREEMLDWLLVTFSGENAHFESSEDWNPSGLADYLMETFGEELKKSAGLLGRDPRAVLACALRLFFKDIEIQIAKTDAQIDAETFARRSSSVNQLNWWTRLFIGAPVEMLTE